MGTDDDDDSPMPSHINSARAVHEEMERRRRKRERKAQIANVAGTILPEAMPPGRGMSDQMPNELTLEQRRLLRLQQDVIASHFRGISSIAETLNSVSSVAPTIQQTSIRSLEPIFKLFTDTEVAVYAMDDQPIGPRIGVLDVPEPTLKAIASAEVQRRGRLSDRKWHIIGGGLAALVAGVVAWILRGLLGA